MAHVHTQCLALGRGGRPVTCEGSSDSQEILEILPWGYLASGQRGQTTYKELYLLRMEHPEQIKPRTAVALRADSDSIPKG